jgi:hypothetical protein
MTKFTLKYKQKYVNHGLRLRYVIYNMKKAARKLMPDRKIKPTKNVSAFSMFYSNID